MSKFVDWFSVIFGNKKPAFGQFAGLGTECFVNNADILPQRIWSYKMEKMSVSAIEDAIQSGELSKEDLKMFKKMREQAMIDEFNVASNELAKKIHSNMDIENQPYFDALPVIQKIIDVYGEKLGTLWKRDGVMVLHQIYSGLVDAGFVESVDERNARLDELGAYRKKSISQSLRMKIFERDDYKCLHCGTNKRLSVDHVIPESKGGTSDLSNLQTLCISCNSRKGASL